MQDDLQKIIKGDINTTEESLTKYSHDASIFEVKPKVVIHPKDPTDISNLINYINKNPKENLSITPRSAGTDMSGGAIGESIILDMTKHFNQVLKVGEDFAITEPGVFYRDFEKETLKKDLLLPCYTASREINTVGGMVGNNSAGEKTLLYGQTVKYVKKLKVILSDGKEYSFGPLTREEVEKKIKQTGFEGQIYKQIYNLIQENSKLIQNAKPKTHKNSTGYNLWDVLDDETFNLAKLFSGSQGTLGVITEIEFQLVKPKKYSETLVITLDNLNDLDKIVSEVLKFNPESFECFDNQTLFYATKFLPEIIKDFKGHHDIGTYLQFLPEIWMKLTNSFPPLVLLAEFIGDNPEEPLQKCRQTIDDLKKFNLKLQMLTPKLAEKYWIIRRDSFGLLRRHSDKMHTAPFIDDIIVQIEYLPEFLPKLNALFAPYKKQMIYTMAGHIGDGNFHIIPLMDLSKEEVRAVIPELMEKVFKLVFEYHGSMSAEHNDGLIRGPYLPEMYSQDVYQLFKKVKEIFDPKNIFNPHKKTDATFEYSLEHMIKN